MNDARSFSLLPDLPAPRAQDNVTTAGGDHIDAKATTTHGAETPPTPEPPVSESREDALDAFIAIIIRDGLDRPIPNLPVKVEVPGAPPVEAITSEQGAVVVPKEGGKGEATLHVRDETAQYQEVCKIDLVKCTTGAAIVRSPKVAEKVALRPHHTRRPASSAPAPAPVPAQPPVAPTSSSDEQTQSNAESGNHPQTQGMPGWLKNVVHPHDSLPSGPLPDTQQTIQMQAANKSGNPIAIIAGSECPNADNLLLGRNGVYRQVILDASKRFKLSPQSIAALIDAEAAKVKDTVFLTNPDGTPKLIKNGKHKGKQAVRDIGSHWDAKSANPTGAAGLTQFIVDTWLRHTTKPGCYINEKCAAKGWVKEIKDKRGKTTCVFILSNGSTTDKPWQHQSDHNVRACLDQRFVAEWAIMAAADYGVANLGRLKALGFKLDGLNDVEKAKLMYLMHHEGEPAGPLVIRNKLNELPKGKYPSVEARIRATLVLQVGEIDAKDRIGKANGDAAKAYRHWLATYIDEKINFNKFCCDAKKFSPPLKSLEIFEKIGGKK